MAQLASVKLPNIPAAKTWLREKAPVTPEQGTYWMQQKPACCLTHTE
jgi:hypothetical protein